MVSFRIRAHCLAQQREWKKEYDDVTNLREDVFKEFQLFNINPECGIIVYYDTREKCDCLLDYSLGFRLNDRKFTAGGKF